MKRAFTVSILNNNTYGSSSQQHGDESLPATAALEEATKQMMEKAKQANSFESKAARLACNFCEMSFQESPLDAFPAIEWESDEDNISDSERSLNDWNAFLSECDGGMGSTSLKSSGRKRGRDSRPLVRSKKIKSDLASLAHSLDLLSGSS